LTPETKIRLLQHELKIARAEIAALRRRLNESGQHGRRLDRAWSDALLLANLHIAHLPTSRRSAEELLNITNNRWENARALLIMAKCHTGKRWVVHDLAMIEERLSEAKELAITEPSAYRARLPRHARGVNPSETLAPKGGGDP